MKNTKNKVKYIEPCQINHKREGKKEVEWSSKTKF